MLRSLQRRKARAAMGRYLKRCIKELAHLESRSPDALRRLERRIAREVSGNTGLMDRLAAGGSIQPHTLNRVCANLRDRWPEGHTMPSRPDEAPPE